MRSVGVFGGTFDPIHIGHLAAVEDAAHTLSLERVLFVPNRQPPHKVGKPVSPAADRVAMVTRAIADNPLFELSLVEQEREGPSHIIDTMRRLKGDAAEDVRMVFLVGCDALRDLHRWYEPQALLDEFPVVVMDRPTLQPTHWSDVASRFPRIREQVLVVHVAQLDISGEDIRRRVRSGLPVRYHVLPQVAEYILARGLYTETERPQWGDISAPAP
ncbi:MAG: nicotinate-nucleotide adenylyltransferase [Chloroflexota bacterium]|nr:MAG: nicotinate (nicotinamide) nucleotide adenylyltransferase [Chloroflexota bacterium]